MNCNLDTKKLSCIFFVEKTSLALFIHPQADSLRERRQAFILLVSVIKPQCYSTTENLEYLARRVCLKNHMKDLANSSLK
jgi:hypothetical protein